MFIVVNEKNEIIEKFETYDKAADFVYAYECINNDTLITIKEVKNDII